MKILLNIIEDKKTTIMSWICFIMAMRVIIITPENWEMILLLLSFSFFPNIMKEFIKRKYNITEEVKNEGGK